MIANKIIFNGELITMDDNGLLYFHGETIRPKKLTPFFLICSSCKSSHIRKVLTKKHVNEVWHCHTCRMSGDKNPFYGKTHTAGTKEKQSQAKIGKNMGEDNPMYGRKIKEFMSPEAYEAWRLKTIENTKKRWEKGGNPFDNIEKYIGSRRFKEMQDKRIETARNFNEEKKKEISKKLSIAAKRDQEKDPEDYIAKKRKAAYASAKSQNRYKKSSIEKIVEDWLLLNNIEHKYSFIRTFEDIGTFQYDFIILNTNYLVECHGQYWHGDPRFYKDEELNNIQIKKRAQDKLKKELIEKEGYVLIEIWEAEIKNKDFSELERLLK